MSEDKIKKIKIRYPEQKGCLGHHFKYHKNCHKCRVENHLRRKKYIDAIIGKIYEIVYINFKSCKEHIERTAKPSATKREIIDAVYYYMAETLLPKYFYLTYTSKRLFRSAFYDMARRLDDYYVPYKDVKSVDSGRYERRIMWEKKL